MEVLNAPMPNPIEFRIVGDETISIWISSEAIKTMLKASSKAGCSETGGILIGRYTPESWFADIVEATPKPKGSQAGRFWFQRSNSGLSNLLVDRWNYGYHYLGEWHYHPNSAPIPSNSDILAMREIANDDDYQCPNPILVILGGNPALDWTISITLFRKGEILRLCEYTVT